MDRAKFTTAFDGGDESADAHIDAVGDLVIQAGNETLCIVSVDVPLFRDFLNAVLPAPEPDREGEKHIPTNCYECPHGIEAQKPDAPRACAPSLVEAVEKMYAEPTDGWFGKHERMEIVRFAIGSEIDNDLRAALSAQKQKDEAVEGELKALREYRGKVQVAIADWIQTGINVPDTERNRIFVKDVRGIEQDYRDILAALDKIGGDHA